MKKIFTLFASALCAVSASANNYYANYAQLNVVPEGAGKVYVGESNTTDETTVWEDKTAEYQGVSRMGYFYLHAQPADGYQLAGFSAATFDDADQPVYNEELIGTSNPTGQDVSGSKINHESEDGARNLMPLEPNRVYYALFTHVKPDYLADMSALGKVSIDKVINEAGDEVTLTATPDTEFDPTAEFDYWVKESTGEKIYENPIKVTVAGKETYKVHFTADNAQVVHFAEDGEYKLWYSDKIVNGHCFPDNVWNTTITLVDKNYVDENDEENNNTTGKTYTTVENVSHYLWTSSTPCLLYGKGDATIIVDGTADADLPDEKQIVRVEEETSAADLSVAYKYYSIDIPKQVFRLIADDAVLEKGSYYIQFDAEKFTEDAPELMYWSKEAAIADGIDAVAADKAVKSGKVYNLNGMQVKSAGKGVYIMDGKKFVNK